MQDNKVFNDLKKLAASSFASMANIKNETAKMVKEQVKTALKSLDIVARSDFEAVKKTVSKLREEIDGIKNQKGGNTMLKKTVKKVARKAVAKKPAAKKAKKK